MKFSLSSPRSRSASRLALCAAAAALVGLAPARAVEPSEFSQAERLVFTERHLNNVSVPGSLRYSFVKSGSLESGFTDEVRLDVKRAATGCCVVAGNFLSGEREVKLPDIAEAESNPVILYFLERDIREMERLTKGKSAYFRKRIRMTMAENASVRATKVNYNGREVAAQEVSIAPYENDPLRSRFERYAGKRYTFVLANAVPGGVYRVSTVLPGALPSDAPVMEETLTLSGPTGAPSSNKK